MLASVSPEARVRATLDYLGLPADGDDALFSAVVCAEDVQRARPDPEMYLYSCQVSPASRLHPRLRHRPLAPP